jgi:alkaline phosphatase D
VFTLDEYRGRYAHIRADADLRAAHQAFPWIMTTDDHEVVNDYANDVAPGNESSEQLLLRRAAAYQAYYEFMPLRQSSMPNGPDLPLYRRVPYGKLARLHVLDTRQYRTPQPCGAGQKPRCEGATGETGTMMGSAQESWLADGLHASDAHWDILANQVLLAQLARDEGEETTFSMDKWDGYAGARGRLLSLLADIEPNNTVAITGDIHSSWVADIKRDFADPASKTIATELVGTSISSGGDGRDSFPGFEALQSRNPHIRFYDGRRGYVRNTVTPGDWTADYRVVPYVERPGAPVETRASFVIEAASPGAHRTDA